MIGYQVALTLFMVNDHAHGRRFGRHADRTSHTFLSFTSRHCLFLFRYTPIHSFFEHIPAGFYTDRQVETFLVFTRATWYAFSGPLLSSAGSLTLETYSALFAL